MATVNARLPNSPEPGISARLRLPQLVDFWVAELGGRGAWSRCWARVVERRVEALDTVTLVLQPNRHFRGLDAGQHLTVGVEVNGRRLQRSYSPSRLPGRRLAITVKRMPGGRVSEQLVRQTRVGDRLELGAAFGAMTLAAAGERPLLLLAAGSGITPMASLLRAATAQGLRQDITLLYWVRRAAERCYAAELQALAAREPRFTLRRFTTGEAPAAGLAPDRRIEAAQLADLLETKPQVYACGPAGFVDNARRLCETRAAGFLGEAFSLPAAPASARGPVRVTLAASGRSLTVAADQPLLAALEAAGLQPAYGCRMGICNSCTCRKLEGPTEDLQTGETQHEPQALRLCVSRAAGDLTLDL